MSLEKQSVATKVYRVVFPISNKMKNLLYLVFFACTLSLGQQDSFDVDKRFGARIIGGGPARAGQFPFAAAIYTTTGEGRYFCGGSLISNQWILTAGHCVEGALRFSIQVGSHTLSSADSNRVTLTTNTSLLHPDFNSMTLENDVGLIRLSEPVLFSDYISSIFLPSTDLQPDAKVISIGWGQTDDFDTTAPVDHLNYVDVVTLTDPDCKNTYGDQIGANMFCVQGEYNEGTCLGDLGTPLVRYVLNERHAEHVGISSFLSGNGCETTDPSGYTKTFAYVQWIKDVTGIA